MKTIALPVVGTVPLKIVAGVGVALILAVWAYSRRDSDGDGEPDSLGFNLGYDLANTAADAVGGVLAGTVAAGDSALDKAASKLGAGYSDCERYKAEGNRAGIIYACWPTEWFK